jgi:hypothetical protein
MPLTINLPQNIEEQFLKEATSEGLSLDNYLLQLLKKVATRKQKPLSETALLKKINLEISETEWLTYHHLIAIRRAERLTVDEYDKLIGLSEKIEQANTKRLQNLVKLAKIRNTSLEKIMSDLGIKPIEV